MSDEPFGRQPKPYTVLVCDGDPIDITEALRDLKRFLERAGDMTQPVILDSVSGFRVYPRAVND